MIFLYNLVKSQESLVRRDFRLSILEVASPARARSPIGLGPQSVRSGRASGLADLPLLSFSYQQFQIFCFAFVCDLTENTGFLKFCRFYCVFQWKSNQNSSKIHKMTFCMQKSMCKKVTNFKSLKVSKLMTLK